MRTGTFEELCCELYATIVRQPRDAELWTRLAGGLAGLFDVPLVVIGSFSPSGTVTALAASRESALWWDLQRVPERWDGSVAGRSLAAMVLDSGPLATLELDDERFACWRDGASRDRLHSGCAVLVRSELGQHLVQLFSPERRGFDDATRQKLLTTAARMRQLFDDIALLREQRLLSRALELAGNAAFITDREGVIVWCNRAFARMYGYSREEVVGQNPRFLKSGRQGVRYYRELWSTIRSGRVWAGETVDRDRNGTAYTVRQTITPFECDDGDAFFLAVHDDISAEHAQHLRAQLRAGVDAATGLMTRAAFEECLTKATTQDGGEWTLMLISLRDFQDGVAALGSQIAEHVAAELASRLRTALGPDLPTAALAPGEYAVQLTHDGSADVDEIAHRIETALAAPFPILNPTLVATPRIAAARFPAEGGDYHDLVHAADRKLADRPVARVRR